MKNEKLNYFVVVSLVVMMIASVLAVMPTAQANGGLVTTDLNPPTLTATGLTNMLVGSGVTVSNVQFTGVNHAAGTFSGGAGILGIDSGIVLSTGKISDVVGPNTYDATTTNNGMPGDADLNTLIPGYTTFDATVLEFDFVPTTSVVTFEYVFGSEEYNEYVGSPFNNVFGFFINGVNQALIPGTTTAVAINNVNNGGTGEMYTWPVTNPAYYRNNDLQQGGGSINTELDGLTVVLTVTANVNAGETNHIKLAIADAGDAVLDSDVFIKTGSFISPTLTLAPLTDTNPTGSSHTLTATLVDADGNPVSGQTITFDVIAGPHSDPTTGTGVTDANGKATWSYTGTNAGMDTIVATGAGETSNKAYKTWEEGPGDLGNCCACPPGTCEGCQCQCVQAIDKNDCENNPDLKGIWMPNGCDMTTNEPCDEYTCEGGECIPEFSTIALPVASILGLLFFFNYRKRKREQ